MSAQVKQQKVQLEGNVESLIYIDFKLAVTSKSACSLRQFYSQSSNLWLQLSTMQYWYTSVYLQPVNQKQNQNSLHLPTFFSEEYKGFDSSFNCNLSAQMYE